MLAQLEGGFWIPYDWSPDDSKALIYQHISANENNLWIIDVTTGREDSAYAQRRNQADCLLARSVQQRWERCLRHY